MYVKNLQQYEDDGLRIIGGKKAEEHSHPWIARIVLGCAEGLCLKELIENFVSFVQIIFFWISNLWFCRKWQFLISFGVSFFDFFRLVRWSTDQPAPRAHSLPLHLPKNVWIFSHSHFLFCIFFSLCTIAFCWKFLLSMEERILSQAFSHATIKFITSGRIILVTRGPVTIQTVSF